MEEAIIANAIKKAFDTERIDKTFAENAIKKLEHRIGLKAVKVLVDKWKNNEITLPTILKILDVNLNELRFVIRELKYFPESEFDSLIKRDIEKIKTMKKYPKIP